MTNLWVIAASALLLGALALASSAALRRQPAPFVFCSDQERGSMGQVVWTPKIEIRIHEPCSRMRRFARAVSSMYWR